MCNRRKKRKKERNNKETFEGICLLLFVPFDSISRVAMKSRRTNKGVLSVGLAVVAAAAGGGLQCLHAAGPSREAAIYN